MGGFNWENMGQGLAALLLGILGAFRLIQGHRAGDRKPPAERAPTSHAVSSACENLEKQIERLHDRLERHMENSDDDVRDIKRQLDGLEASLRVMTAMAGIEHRYGRNKRDQN